MSRYCPIVDHKVTYQFCQECEDRQCQKRPVKTGPVEEKKTIHEKL